MTRHWVRFLGASQLLGGILVVSAYAVGAVAWPRAIAPWQNGLAVAFGAFVGFAGVQLLRASPRAIGLSIVAQAVQVFAATQVPGWRYVGIAGLKGQLILATNGIHVALGGGGEFIAVPWARNGSLDSIAANLETGLRIASNGLEHSTTTVGINVVAIYFLWKLVMLRAETRPPQRSGTALAPAL
jgi:hypothetical protein